MIIDNADNKFAVENSPTSIKVIIHGNRQWGWFLPAFFVFLINGFCFLPIVGLAVARYMQQHLSEIFQGMVLLFLVGLYFFILYKKSFEPLEYIFDTETIEIDDQSITIERSGFLGLKSEKVFLAENIKALTTSFSISEQFKFLDRLPFTSSNLGAFMIWHGRGLRQFYNFGKGVDPSEAQRLMNMVYLKFPKYRYTGTS